ncbi:hypothetical protein LOD99_5603 [Oopsacas minuta]|uniref:Uncharacterized protein n=1 Tax=Oopsacas minuta TaxID=111878 RepID=A0AAV7JRL9_9METZ|nr:hypothetical protein LOD99_5603 [Oopsacas minuta]
MDTLINRNYNRITNRDILSKDCADFMYVEGLAICPFTDRIFVATGLIMSILVFTTTGDYLYSITDNSRSLFCPWGLCFIGEVICVTEHTNNSIAFITTDGDIVTRVGENCQIFPGVLLSNPTRLTAYLDTDIFLCDSGNHQVLHLFPDLPLCRRIGVGKLSKTEDVKVYNNEIFVLDWRSPCIAIFNMSGEFIARIITHGSSTFNQLNDVVNPYCFTIDNAGNLILSDSGSNSIRVFTRTGKMNIKFGSRGDNIGKFEYPMGIGINSSSQIVSVCRRNNNSIQIF